MRFRLIFGFFATGLLAAGVVTGCGGSDSETGGTGGSATTSSSSSSSSSHTSSVTSSSSGMMGDGNDTFETATPITVGGQATQADLTPTGDVDYYSFSGTQGQALYIAVDAQDSAMAYFDPSYIDTIITLYDANKNQIAEATTGVPSVSGDPELETILPAAGTYYVRVEECWTWIKEHTSYSCASPQDKTSTSYQLILAALDASSTGEVAEVEPNDDAMTATPMEYGKNPNGGYYFTDAWGTFSAPTDVDVYKVNIPADTQATDGRPTGNVLAWAAGTSGDGSTTPIGKLYLVDPANPTVHLAEVDASTGSELAPPLTFGQDYYLYVERPAGTAGANDFYFLRHYGGGSNPLEMADMANGTAAGAEPLTVTNNGDGSYSYYVDGDIFAAPMDVDYYSVDTTVIASGATIGVACGAQRLGSGLRGLTFTVTQPDGTPLAMASAVEDATKDAYFGGIAIPTGATTLLVKVQATSQDSTVSSTFYRCGIHLTPP